MNAGVEGLVRPDDEHNRELVANVHPSDWVNPAPEGRYNIVVIGAGTAGLVIAVVAAGYADGVFRQLSGCGSVRARGRWVPMLGTVSMDMTTIDATDVPELKAGEAVELLGEGFDASGIAALTGTIPYDVLCKIHPRVRRVHV